MSAVYSVYTSPNHAPVPNHLPTLIVTPHGQPSNILYSYLHTNFNSENYLLTPSPQGDLCVAKLYPPRQSNTKSSVSDPGHGSASASSARVVKCEASRNLRWSITNTGVVNPIYKLSLPSPDSNDLPLFQISKPNPNAQFWSMFYFAYAGHLIPPKRIEFGRIQKNPPGPGGGGTRITISGQTPEEKAVWQTLGDGNEDCVEWVVLCAALNLLDDEILKAADKTPGGGMQAPPPQMPANPAPPANPVARGPPPNQHPPQQQHHQAPPPQQGSNRLHKAQPPQNAGPRPQPGYPAGPIAPQGGRQQQPMPPQGYPPQNMGQGGYAPPQQYSNGGQQYAGGPRPPMNPPSRSYSGPTPQGPYPGQQGSQQPPQARRV